MKIDFSQPFLLDHLKRASDADLDGLEFGVVKLDRGGRVLAYNRYESDAAGLSRDRVIGRHFFAEVGPCMDNALVAGRFEGDGELDLELDYVFALRLRPEPVRLRLLQSAAAAERYLLVKRSGDGSR